MKYFRLTFTTTLALLFITLQLVGAITWSWFWVLSPLILTVALNWMWGKYYAWLGTNSPLDKSEVSVMLNAVNALALIFIALKLTNVIAWSWWLVLLPVWTPLALLVLLLIPFAIAIGFGPTTMEEVRLKMKQLESESRESRE